MKLLSILRKLGIVRYGFKAGTYKGGADRPYEFMSDDILNAKEETVTKEEFKKVFGKKKAVNGSQAAKFCPKCGSPLRSASAFCTKCGNKLVASEQASQDISEADPSPAVAPAPPPLPKKSRKGIGCLVAVIVAFLLIAGFVALVVSAMKDSMVKEAERIQITLENALAYAADTKIPEAAEGAEFKLYENKEIGIATEMPRIWTSKSVRGALVFSGPPTTEQEKTTINLQAVVRADNFTLQQQAEDFLGQLQSCESFLMEGSALDTFRDAKAAFVLVSYKANDMKFRQLQVIVERDDIYVFIGYTAPADIFDKYLYAMYHCIYNFRNIPIERNQDSTSADSQGGEQAGGLKDLVKSIDETFQAILGGSTGGKSGQ